MDLSAMKGEPIFSLRMWGGIPVRSSICPFSFEALFSLFFGFVASLNSLSCCIAPLFAIVGHTQTFFKWHLC